MPFSWSDWKASCNLLSCVLLDAYAALTQHGV